MTELERGVRVKGRATEETSDYNAEVRHGTFQLSRNGIGVGHKGIMLLSVGGTIFLKHGARRMGVFFIA